MVRGRTIFLILLLMSPSLASAQAMRVNAAQSMTYGDAAALLGKSCGADIEANCRGLNLDEISTKGFSGSVTAVDRALAEHTSVVCCDTNDAPWLGVRPSVRCHTTLWR